MRKYLLLSLISVVLFASTAALADTIHLKNGSVLKGKVTSFADDQFVVLLDTGSGRYLSKAMVYMGDVERIEFDAAGITGDSSSTATQPADAPPRNVDETSQREMKSRASDTTETPVRTVETPTRETGPPETQTAPPPLRESESTQPEKSTAINRAAVTAPPVSESDSERSPRRSLAAIKTMSVDVAAKKDWTSSGLIVKRGDHLRITASGTITLDPVNGRTCGPEGIDDLVDPKKLMPDQPTGALIAVISSDNDDFIFLGRSGEFTATRDGLLFLSVNEGMLSDNIGAFKAVVEVLAQRKQ